MGDFLFTAEFKHRTVEQIRSGETPLATIARELDIQKTVLGRRIQKNHR